MARPGEHGGAGRIPIPREHGAWGLVLQPFIAAAVLGWRWDVALIPSLAFVLLGFLIREPLTILARRRRADHPSSSHALRWLVVEAAGILVCFAILLRSLPWQALTLLFVVGFALTMVSVLFALKNRQRAVSLQVAAVAGLGSSAFLSALASTHAVPGWAWLLWAILTLHGMVSVLCVHARLEMRISATRPARADPRRRAVIATILQALAVFPAVFSFSAFLAIPLVFSSAIHAIELFRLSNPANVRERLQRVGFRMLGLSLAHTVLAIIVLWPSVER